MPCRFDQAHAVVTAPTNGQQMLCFPHLDGSDRLHRIQTRDGALSNGANLMVVSQNIKHVLRLISMAACLSVILERRGTQRLGSKKVRDQAFCIVFLSPAPN